MGGLRGGRGEGGRSTISVIAIAGTNCDRGSYALAVLFPVESWFKICNSNSARPDNYQLIGTTAINSRWARTRESRASRVTINCWLTDNNWRPGIEIRNRAIWFYRNPFVISAGLMFDRARHVRIRIRIREGEREWARSCPVNYYSIDLLELRDTSC